MVQRDIMTVRDFATYHVGFKILLKKGDEFLFLKSVDGSTWDFPGGRIDEVEHETPLQEVLDREVREELGNEIEYEVYQPIAQFRRHFESYDVHVFITVFAADYIAGEIKLSNEHSEFIWINPKEHVFKESDFFSKEEFDAIMKYFQEA